MPERGEGAVKNPSSTLLALKPRQVLLADCQHRQKSHPSSSTKPTLMALGEGKKGQQQQGAKTLTADEKTGLLHSILHYLDSNSFSKSLKRLLKDAMIQDDSWKASNLDLEHIYSVYLENCNKVNMKLASEKEPETRVSEVEQHGDAVTALETAGKKKKKKSDVKGDTCAHPDSENLSSHKDVELEVSSKSKKDKKRDSLGEANLSSPCDSLVDKSSKEQKKMKKKHKLTSESFQQDAKQSDLKSGLTEEKLENGNGDDFKKAAESKDKKKKKKPTTECLVEDQKSDVPKDSTGLVDDKSNSDIPLEQSEVNPKEKKKNKDGKEKKSLETTEDMVDTKKRKRSASTENESEPIEGSVPGESKRRKTEGLEEPKKVEQNGSEKESKKENGELNVNGISKNGVKKSGQKKPRDDSAEPKIVNAFQRVKADEVEFVDERLKDNSYWAKDGAEIGYGAKAQEVLGQVRGRDFRHEKTKKKRGSYRGGQIDLQSHSVKFNYSDEE